MTCSRRRRAAAADACCSRRSTARIDQRQSALESPQQHRPRLHPDGDRQATNSLSAYTG